MKRIIGVVTLRLLTNCGGVLQNAALQMVLHKLGFIPVTLAHSLPMILDTWQLEKGEAGQFAPTRSQFEITHPAVRWKW